MNRRGEVGEELGCTTIRLDATPLGQPLYESLGFVPQYELTRYAGIAGSIASVIFLFLNCSRVRIANSNDIADHPDLDAPPPAPAGKFLSRSLPRSLPRFESLNVMAKSPAISPSATAAMHPAWPCIAETAEAGSALLTDALTAMPAAGSIGIFLPAISPPRSWLNPPALRPSGSSCGCAEEGRERRRCQTLGQFGAGVGLGFANQAAIFLR